ncbi:MULTISPECIES: NAD(P)-dependent alcohol dehydrogenase [unclassified Methylophaga]|jgi:uncharacterized zinc-type alcohol dehydrogenase-like protein|uniref:NADPH-dependent aldehyde reductase Ahr n=3 Tax=Methylophaga TaxID=40222 RepID=UPI000C44BBAD|nr:MULTISPECIES: NAD(P)-dependent alcohol dehydrogenase [unclassified Methylophaga]MAL48414.1 alcohol dehydrogenase [Methylophaga sp.]MBP24904.1 alcohol dehydrogenase [Methylophaga sp.]|tara:strand:+ start:4009 stop:5007 length:999 start_codon:yes stop_codon:yes gene_type:complete
MINAYAALERGAKLTPYQYDPGLLGEHEVEIEVRYCGICHSDISIIDNDWGMSIYPVVAGHEVVGTISQIGAAVTNLEVGQTVGLGWYADYCETCEQCHNGDENICSDLTPTIVGHHGGFADKVRANANSVIPLPEAIDLKSVGPLLCGGLTVFNPLVQFDIKPTDKVAVIGIGGLGHIALQFLQAWGCEVTAFTSAAKLQEALDMGAHYSVDSRDAVVMAELPRKFDMLLSTVNVKLDWNLYLSKLKPKGRLHFVGATMDPLDIKVFNLTEAQRSISGSDTGSMQTCNKMLEFAQRHQVKPVVEMYPFDQINEAIEKLRKGDVRYRIVLER